MPRYCFECPACQEKTIAVRAMTDSAEPELCPCGIFMERDYAAEHSSVRGDFNEPIVSESLAFDSVDLAEHRRRFPGVDVAVDGRSARPILRNRTQKRDYLKGRGWVDTHAFM